MARLGRDTRAWSGCGEVRPGAAGLVGARISWQGHWARRGLASWCLVRRGEAGHGRDTGAGYGAAGRGVARSGAVWLG